MKADVVIPSYKPDEIFLKLIKMLHDDMKEHVEDIYIMNTEQSIWEESIPSDFSEKYPRAHVFHISKAEFDHGKTRALGMDMTHAPFVLFMTQDALPVDHSLVENLLKPLMEDESIAVSYARQLPNEKCNSIERLTRDFNYPDISRIKSISDLDELGIKTFFCSNVCALYRKETYLKLGGFTYPAIFNEDMVYAGHAVKAGYKIAYVAEARVVHSHNYTGKQQFHRNFDLGVSQTDHPEVFEGIKSESEGVKMIMKNMLSLINSGNGFLIPKLIWLSGCKYLGYRKGRTYKTLSKEKIMKYTMNPSYWNTL